MSNNEALQRGKPMAGSPLSSATLNAPVDTANAAQAPDARLPTGPASRDLRIAALLALNLLVLTSSWYLAHAEERIARHLTQPLPNFPPTALEVLAHVAAIAAYVLLASRLNRAALAVSFSAAAAVATALGAALARFDGAIAVAGTRFLASAMVAVAWAHARGLAADVYTPARGLRILGIVAAGVTIGGWGAMAFADGFIELGPAARAAPSRSFWR